MATTFVKRSSSSTNQGLFLLALVLLAFSAIPAPISGQSIDGRKSKMSTVGETTFSTDVLHDEHKAVIHDDNDIFNGCHYNEKPHSETALFCCSKDNLCWPSLPECAANCPCKVNCG